jgi:hypothetical protein
VFAGAARRRKKKERKKKKDGESSGRNKLAHTRYCVSFADWATAVLGSRVIVGITMQNAPFCFKQLADWKGGSEIEREREREREDLLYLLWTDGWQNRAQSTRIYRNTVYTIFYLLHQLFVFICVSVMLFSTK